MPIMILLILAMLPAVAHAETNEEARLRSGIITGDLNFPQVVAQNSSFQISGQSSSYLHDLAFEFQIKSGASELVRRPLSITSSAEGSYQLSGVREQVYNFSASVMLTEQGLMKLGIYSFIDGESSPRMYSRIVDRDVGVVSKEAKQAVIYVTPPIGSSQGQCVYYARSYLVSLGYPSARYPGLGVDGGAHLIPERWAAGLEEVISLKPGELGLVVLDQSSRLENGHVALAHGQRGESIAVSESNWTPLVLTIAEYRLVPGRGFTRNGGSTLYPGRLFKILP
jgi:hypothetical protein